MKQTALTKGFSYRLICILLVGIILLLSGCSNEEKEIEVFAAASIQYYTFEELLEISTDIVIGEYVRKHTYSNETVLDFKIEDRILGEDVGDSISVTVFHYDCFVVGTALSYKNDTSYKKGERYLLVLTREKSVYYDEDMYYITGANMYFPLSNLKESTLYGDNIANHSSQLTDTEQLTEEELTAHINQITQNNTVLFTGIDYIHSNDLKTIVQNSNYIFEIEVGEALQSAREGYHAHECTVIDILKGEIVDSQITIGFNDGMVKEGKTYIIALESVSELNQSFALSSKNSIWKTSKRKKIEGYLK